MVNITFPDGAVREFESGVTTFEIAQSISNIVATVLCLHKNKEVVLKQSTLCPSHQPALALKVGSCSTCLR